MNHLRGPADTKAAAAFLATARSLLDARDPNDLSAADALRAWSSSDAVRSILMAFAQNIRRDPAKLMFISAAGALCHQDGADYVRYRAFTDTAEHLYVHGHKYVEVVTSPPTSPGVLREYCAEGMCEGALRLNGPFKEVQLRLVGETPVTVGQAVIKKHPWQVFDWSHGGEMRTLKAVLPADDPYELIFAREDGAVFCGALESNFRSGLLQAAIDILQNCPEPGDRARLRDLTYDHDPLVAWHALRGLDRLGSPDAPEILKRLAQSGSSLLAEAAAQALSNLER